MERLLLFTLGGKGFAFDLQEVAEVMEPQPGYPVPRAPEHFVGMISFHGAPTALVDLGLFLGTGRSARAQGKVLALDTRLASLALWVDGVSAVIPASSVLARLPAEDELSAELLETEHGPVRLLKAETLLGALERGL